MPELKLYFTDTETEYQIASRAVKSLIEGDYIAVRGRYFKVIRGYASGTDQPPAGARVYTLVSVPLDQNYRQPARLTTVAGCTRCGKPAGLVGDFEPADKLCPWCRKAGNPLTPGANKLWEDEVQMRSQFERDHAAKEETLEVMQVKLSALLEKILALTGGEEVVLALIRKLSPVAAEPVIVPVAAAEPEVEAPSADVPVAEPTEPAEAPAEPEPVAVAEGSRIAPGQVWAPRDVRRKDHRLVIQSVTATHAIPEFGRPIQLSRLRLYRRIS